MARSARASRGARRTDPVFTVRGLELLLGLLLVPLFYGGSCTISGVYCSEDCDPCVETCQCANNQTCEQALRNGRAGDLRLESYALAIEVGDDGSLVQTFGAIVGLSLRRSLAERALELAPERAWERSDLVRFADGVLRANPDLFGRADGWRVAAVERFGGETVVVFERADASLASLAFLFDRAGDLVEIVRQAAASTPR